MSIEIPSTLRSRIPQHLDAGDERDPMVWVRLIAPAIEQVWYILTMNGPVPSLWRDDDFVFFGWVIGWNTQLKNFTLSDLEQLPTDVTLDAAFAPCPLSTAVRQELGVRTTLPLGQAVITSGAKAAFEAIGEEVIGYLTRHSRGDWGTLDAEDTQENVYAFVHQLRILSCYTLPSGITIWIITEADRSTTTILLPEEY